MNPMLIAAGPMIDGEHSSVVFMPELSICSKLLFLMVGEGTWLSTWMLYFCLSCSVCESRFYSCQLAWWLLWLEVLVTTCITAPISLLTS